MAVRKVGTLLGVLVLAGCSHSLSGTYQTSDANDVAGLQLTENKDQQLMGSLSVVGMTSDGTLIRKEYSITGGTTDGRAITLTMKANGLFGEAANIAGTVSGSGIDLTLNNVITHFAASNQAALADDVAVLEAAAKARRASLAGAKERAKDAETIAALTRDLENYNEREANYTGMDKAKSAEGEVLVAARKDLAIKKQLDAENQTFQAGQVAFRIGQLDFRMGQIKFQVNEAIDSGNSHLAGFDKRLSTNPCNATPSLQGCAALAVQQQRYSTTRARVQGDIAQMQADIRENGSAMDSLNKAAGN
ncbi:MAG: hypothetical protein EPN36_12095 [Rhodanobacteraceae bacterium]|nr:MAG: hypothetical protein EPN36_12095 [Rhodanobacteraceae bacterium]